MKYNPAASLGMMWQFLQMGHQQADIPRLKEYVYDLIEMMTQKTAGQSKYKKPDELDWTTDLEMTVNSIVIESMCLVLSGKLDELED
jgi:hypothetical protein